MVAMRCGVTMVEHLCTHNGFFNLIRSTIGVKEGCPYSPSLFGIYVYVLEWYPRDNTDVDDDYNFHHVLLIGSLLFVVDMIFLTFLLDNL